MGHFLQPNGMKEEELNKQIRDLLKKNGYKIGYNLSFPIYRILPDEVQLALGVLQKHGMVIQMTLEQEK